MQHTAMFYRGCAIQGHQGQPLDKVCVDATCTQHEIVCAGCAESHHKDHQVMLLPQFLEKLSISNGNSVQLIRGLRNAYA